MKSALKNKLMLGITLALIMPSLTFADEWRSAGRALMTDGWFLPLCATSTSTPYEVEIQSSASRPDVIRLVNPFTSPLAQASCCEVGDIDRSADNYMEIDLSRPDCVVIPLTPTGISIDGREVLAGNFAGYYKTAYGFDTDSFMRLAMAELGAGYIDRFNNGVLTITLSCHTFADDISTFSAWPGSSAKTSTIKLNYAASTTFPSPDRDIAPRYYNLLGMPVAEPRRGQILICVTRSDISTVVIDR